MKYEKDCYAGALAVDAAEVGPLIVVLLLHLARNVFFLVVIVMLMVMDDIVAVLDVEIVLAPVLAMR